MAIPQRFLRCAAACFLLIAVSVCLRSVPPVSAVNSDLVFDEILAGANGDSSLQFIELRMTSAGQNCWGPQVAPGTTGADADDSDCFLGADETRSRAMLVFFDGAGRETGRYKFPENPPGGAGTSVLVATAAFAAVDGAPAPDFVMPPLLNAVNGKVCFSSNDENPAAEPFLACVSYGAFAGTNDGEGAPAAALPTTNTVSLQRQSGTSANINAQFSSSTVPVPVNAAGQTCDIPLKSQVAQGQALFTRETFGGNGRTCATCHVADLSNRLTPANVQSRFATLSTTFDPLFVAESNMNLNTLTVTARPTPASGTDFLNTSGGDLRGVITDAGARTAKVVGRVSATSYLIYGGAALAGTVSDASGNRATVTSVTPGDLNGLEDPTRMRTSKAAGFQQGRALILENIDGFDKPPVFRKSPHLLNLRFTAPFGFSGEFADLQTFAAGAVRQHLPRSLARATSGSNPDFRAATTDELAALEAFLLSGESLGGSDPGRFDLDRYAVTQAQKNGRNLFVGRCSKCHGGPLLGTTTVDILGKGIGVNASFNTGVMAQAINQGAFDNLPCEPASACNTRQFSVPQLFNIKDLGPYFHDGSAPALLDAINFYCSNAFAQSPAGKAVGTMCFTASGVSDVAEFLNALDNKPRIGLGTLVKVRRNVTLPPVPFTLQDPDTPLADLTIAIASSNPAFLPVSNIAVTGSGGDRTLVATPAAGAFGSSIVTITANDGFSSTSAAITVAVNDPPTISTIPSVTIAAASSSGPLPFTVTDESPDALTFTATPPGSNFLPSIVFGGSGANRTITLTPNPKSSGFGSVTVTVSDGIDTASTSFQVVVNKPADPRMALDAPANNSTTSQPFLVGGWAADLGAELFAGIKEVHVWAFPADGGPATFLGLADYGRPRPDVSAVLGGNSGSSGFLLVANGLVEGKTYDIGAYPLSNVSGTFSQARFARVTIAPPKPDPDMSLELPAPDSSFNAQFPILVRGWALDRGSVTFAGVDQVHVWAFPENGGPAIFAGLGFGGLSRPDVAATYGSRFVTAGFQVGVRLPAGRYTLAVYPRSTVTGTFNQQRNVSITVTAATLPAMIIDMPSTGTTNAQPFLLAGWANDRAAQTGTGVDVVHVWAFPIGGGGGLFAGQATYGIARPDVGNVYGARFTNSGYELMVDGLPPGTYDVVVFARSTQTGVFDSRVVRLTVQASAAPSAATSRAEPDPALPLPAVSPSMPGDLTMRMESPLPDAEISGPVTISGVLLDRLAQAGDRVGGVHLYANGVFLGVAQLSGAEWRLDVPALPPGAYEITAYAWSDRTQRFELSQTVRVAVR